MNPRPPFWAGGEFIKIDGRPYLKDAEGAVALQGDGALFEGINSGDLAQFKITERNENSLLCTDREIVWVSTKERPAPKPNAQKFKQFTNDVRTYLISRGLRETATPTLTTCPGLEPSLEPFATLVTRGSHSETKYLPTSPEIHLKKALARGHTDIFEIRSCFRRGEFSEHHTNEFQMLEWYRGFADLELVIEDLRGMLRALRVDVEIQVTDFAALFKKSLNFTLTPSTTRDQLKELAGRVHIDMGESDTFTDIFHRLMFSHLEPAMKKMGPLVVRRFPPEMAALAKIDSEGWADRFEFYWNGLEIANAFNEVTDPGEQLRRWQGELLERRRLGTSDIPMDPEMIEALKIGLPPTGGIALGLERLYMAINGVKNINDLHLF